MSALFSTPDTSNAPPVIEEEEDPSEEERRRRARDLATRGRRATILTQGGPQEANVERRTLLGG